MKIIYLNMIDVIRVHVACKVDMLYRCPNQQNELAEICQEWLNPSDKDKRLWSLRLCRIIRHDKKPIKSLRFGGLALSMLSLMWPSNIPKRSCRTMKWKNVHYRYIIDDNRILFLLQDASRVDQVKDYLIQQDRCEEVIIDDYVYYGQHTRVNKGYILLAIISLFTVDPSSFIEGTKYEQSWFITKMISSIIVRANAAHVFHINWLTTWSVLFIDNFAMYLFLADSNVLRTRLCFVDYLNISVWRLLFP
jgi:hypothetical protein